MGRIVRLLIVAQIFWCGESLGQHFTFHTDALGEGLFFYRDVQWGIYDIATCRDSIFYELQGRDIRDIAIPFGGELFTYAIKDSFLSSYEGLAVFYPEQNFLRFQGEFQFVDHKYVTALSCHTDGLIYGAGKGVTTYNRASETYTYLGDLPLAMQAAGDLTFRQGKLYLSTISNTLVEVDIRNPMNSRVVMTFPVGTPLIHAMTTLQGDCNNTITYAIGTDSTGSIIYELDFENKTLHELCRTPLRIMGAASQQECVTPICKVYVDLDKNNSSGGSRYDFRPTSVCIAPVYIADRDLEVYSEEPIDSVVVTLNGILDVGLENLTASSAANLTVTGSGTTRIKIVNSGIATNNDFQVAISSIFYKNNKAIPTNGNREVWVRGYTLSYVGEIATTSVQLQNNLALEQDSIYLKCHGDAGISFTAEAKGGVAPYRYQWVNGDTTAIRNGLAVGNYSVIISDQSGCQLVDTIRITQPDSLRVNLAANSDTICGTSGQLMANASGGTAPYTYDWVAPPGSPSDGELGRLNNLSAGNYAVTVTDKNGCQANAAYQLFAGDTVRTQERRTLCATESFSWNGKPITRDTSFCVAYRAVAGCDSLHCITIQFLDTVLVQERRTICEGEIYTFNGQALRRDTSICVQLTGANGCDSTYCLQLEVVERTRLLAVSICEGETYSFAGRTLATTGTYTNTILNVNGCDSLIVLSLQVVPKPAVRLIADGRLCEGGRLKIEAPIGFSRYDWSNGASTVAIEVKNPGSYRVTVTNAQGCTDTASITIANESFQPVITATPPACFGQKNGSIVVDSVIGGNPPYFYRLDNRTAQAVNQFNQLIGGIYEVEVEDNNGCFVKTAVTLTEPAPLILLIGDDTTIPLGDSLVLTAQTNAIAPLIRWRPSEGLSCDSCLTTVAKPTKSVDYEAIVMDQFGCVVKEKIAVLINRQTGLYVPTAFSPNGDGVNDVFTVFVDGSVAQINYLRVFDRWGNFLFEIKDFTPGNAEKGWDGTFNRQELPTGVYVYAMEIRKVDGTVELLRGETLLVR